MTIKTGPIKPKSIHADDYVTINADMSNTGTGGLIININGVPRFILNADGNIAADSVLAASIQLSGGEGDQGKLSWNDDEETLDLVMNGSVLQLGHELQGPVRNATGTLIANGDPIMFAGTLGASGILLVAPMTSTVQASAKYILGIATTDIPANGDGKGTVFGKVRGIDTSGGKSFGGLETWNDSDLIYLDPIHDGYLTNVEPTASSSMNISIGVVINSHASVGSLYVRITPLDRNVYATVASPTFTGDPAAPTQSANDNSTKLATTEYADAKVAESITDGLSGIAPSQDVVFDALALKAPLDSPAFTNTPTAPTQNVTDNSSRLATTEFISNKLAYLNVFSIAGVITNADTNPDYPAADAGDVYIVTTNAGRIGGASGPVIEIRDTLLCIVDSTASGDHTTVGANWVIGQVNLQPELYALLTGAIFTGRVTLSVGSDGLANVSLTTAAKNAIVSPPNGLQVYDTDLKDLQVFKPTSAFPAGVWSSLGGSSGSVSTVVESSHANNVGQWVRPETDAELTAGVSYYIPAQGDLVANADCMGLIQTASVDAYEVRHTGEIELTTTQIDAYTNSAIGVPTVGGWTPGKVYYLDPSEEGKITDREITIDLDGDTAVIKPMLYALTATKGLVLNLIGSEIYDPAVNRYQTFLAADLIADVLTVQHDFGHSIVWCAVYDDDDHPVLLDWVPNSGNPTTHVDIDFTGVSVSASVNWRVVISNFGAKQDEVTAPVASNADPLALGEADSGVASTYSRADHRHEESPIYAGGGVDFSLTFSVAGTENDSKLQIDIIDGLPYVSGHIVFTADSVTLLLTIGIGSLTFKNDGIQRLISTRGSSSAESRNGVSSPNTGDIVCGVGTASTPWKINLNKVPLESIPAWATRT